MHAFSKEEIYLYCLIISIKSISVCAQGPLNRKPPNKKKAAVTRGPFTLERCAQRASLTKLDDTQPLLPSSSSTSHIMPSLVPVG